MDALSGRVATGAAPCAGRSDERGLTLIEVVVAAALVVLVAAFGAASLSARPAQAAMSALTFAGLVREARALAAVTADGSAQAGSGATIGVTSDASGSVATLYAYRPIQGALHEPVAVARAPLRSAASLAIVDGGVLRGPPFALFFSPSGHVSSGIPYTVGVDAPLAAEPACPLQTGIVIAFRDGAHDQAHALSCAMARLDVQTSVPLGAP
jgi:prepilin-type N-terminal cleavage/methylation domain-containing protein